MCRGSRSQKRGEASGRVRSEAPASRRRSARPQARCREAPVEAADVRAHNPRVSFLRDADAFHFITYTHLSEFAGLPLAPPYDSAVLTVVSRDMGDAIYTWVFVRGQDGLTIQRLTPVCLAISSATGDRRLHDFDSAITLLEFQFGLHVHLIERGWALDAFNSERRIPWVDRRLTQAAVAVGRVLSSRRPPGLEGAVTDRAGKRQRQAGYGEDPPAAAADPFLRAAPPTTVTLA